jgi:hypothetical protein
MGEISNLPSIAENEILQSVIFVHFIDGDAIMILGYLLELSKYKEDIFRCTRLWPIAASISLFHCTLLLLYYSK